MYYVSILNVIYSAKLDVGSARALTKILFWKQRLSVVVFIAVAPLALIENNQSGEYVDLLEYDLA